MKYLNIVFALLVFFCGCIISCTQDDMVDGHIHIEGGKPVKIDISIHNEFHSRSVGLSEAEEKQFNNIQLFVFDSDGVKVTSKFFPNVNVNTDLKGIETVSGTGMQIYLIANITPLNANFTDIFDNVATINDLNNLIVYTTGNDVLQDRLLLMQGNLTTDIPEGITTCKKVSIDLDYVMSKICVMVVDSTAAGESVSWDGWRLKNNPTKSYIIPRNDDAVDPNVSSDFISHSSSTLIDYTDTTYTASDGTILPAKYAEFYMFENRRGGRTGGNTGVDPKDKNTYAPSRATAIISEGSYFKNNAAEGIVTTIYLGANSYNDYNVERSNKYYYTIKVRSINDIAVDSRIESTGTQYEIEYASLGLDCHYDWRPIRITSFEDVFKIEIMSGTNVAGSSFWLKISDVNINQFVDNGSGVFIRPTYNPTTVMKTVINNIVFPASSVKTSKTFYLYADEFIQEGGSRNAMIKITDKTNNSIFIGVSQYGYKVLGSNVGLRYFDNATVNNIVNSSDFRLAVENTEEATLAITPWAAAGSEQTNTMQFGFSNFNIQPSNSLSIDYYKRNGFDISKIQVLDNGVLRAPWGRIGTNTISEQIHNPIFNSYAARYCFEKNRDVDGNGKIEGSEIKWYLPSIDELELLFVGNPYLGIPNTAYTSSTQFGTNQLFGIRLDLGRSGFATKTVPLYIRCVRKIDASNTKSSPYVEPNSLVVNTTGFATSLKRTTAVGVPTPDHTEGDAINQSFSPRFEVALTDVSGTHNWNNNGGQCEGYKQPGEAQASKTWRSPTQRELYLIYLVHRELEGSGVAGFQNFIQNGSEYWSSTEYSLSSSQAWAMNFRDGVMYNRTKSTKYYLRCVKDL